METITITVTNDRLTKLKQVAADFDVTLEELVHLSVENLLLQPEVVFQRAMEYTLDKNRELYQRLGNMREEFDFSHTDLEAAYQQMAQDEERESLALEWAEATIGDVGDEAGWSHLYGQAEQGRSDK